MSGNVTRKRSHTSTITTSASRSHKTTTSSSNRTSRRSRKPSSSSETLTASQKQWATGIRTGNFDLAIDALEDEGFTEYIDGKPVMEAFLAGRPTAQMLSFILSELPDGVIETVPNLAYRIVGLPIAQDELIRMLDELNDNQMLPIQKDTRKEAQSPLDLALRRDLPEVVTYLLEAGVSPMINSSVSKGLPIYMVVNLGLYPPAASAAFRSFMVNPTSQRRVPNPTEPNTFYKGFKAKEAIRRSLVAEAIERFKETGPICSTEGAFQHRGECWNDAVYMLFLFADGLKERTQPAILMGDLSTMAASVIERTSVGWERAKQLYIYLEATQSRFARHLLNQIETEETCRTDMTAAIATGYGRQRAAGVNALMSAVMGAEKRIEKDGESRTIDPYTVSESGYVAGNEPYSIMRELIPMFGLSDLIDHKTYAFSVAPPNRATLVVPVDTVAGIVLASRSNNSTHATCMYSCNGVEYFYDDNIGVFQYPWRKLFGQLDIEVTIVTVKDTTLSGVATRHWPAFHDRCKKKLIIPSLRPTGDRVNVFDWDEVSFDTKKSWTVGTTTFTYVKNSSVFSLNVLTFKTARPAVPKRAPPIVGRGPFRVPYRSTNSSSERRALGR